MTALTGLLEEIGVPYMIAGSIASAAHGLPTSTRDVDIAIDPVDLTALEALLRRSRRTDRRATDCRDLAPLPARVV